MRGWGYISNLGIDFYFFSVTVYKKTECCLKDFSYRLFSRSKCLGNMSHLTVFSIMHPLWLIFLVNDQHEQYVFLMWIWNLCSARCWWQKMATSFSFIFACFFFFFFCKAILPIVYKIYYLEWAPYLFTPG